MKITIFLVLGAQNYYIIFIARHWRPFLHTGIHTGKAVCRFMPFAKQKPKCCLARQQRKDEKMGFTVEDMQLVSKTRYRMKLVAGKNGWSNSISWILMLEDVTIVQRFSGKEMAVTTGLGFLSEEKLMTLMKELVKQQASGLIINTGYYIRRIPGSVKKYADENSLPLLTVPWDVEIAEMIKDLSIRIFLQGSTDEQISTAFIEAIETPDEYEKYSKVLLPHFDVGGTFQAVVLHRPGLGEMDTVERKRLSYRLQLALTNLTHNGHFFYYDGAFVVIMNAVRRDQVRAIIDEYRDNIGKRLPDIGFVIGVGSQCLGIRDLYRSYQRAVAAAHMAEAMKAEKASAPSGNGNAPAPGSPSDRDSQPCRDSRPDLVIFDRMGIYRIFYSVADKQILLDFEKEYLGPLIKYDKEHNSDYVETLENYLRYGGSIQKVAQVMFIHRNTINYRMNNIRGLLGCELDTEEDRVNFMTACLIRKMRLS